MLCGSVSLGQGWPQFLSALQSFFPTSRFQNVEVTPALVGPATPGQAAVCTLVRRAGNTRGRVVVYIPAQVVDFIQARAAACIWDPGVAFIPDRTGGCIQAQAVAFTQVRL